MTLTVAVAHRTPRNSLCFEEIYYTSLKTKVHSVISLKIFTYKATVVNLCVVPSSVVELFVCPVTMNEMRVRIPIVSASPSLLI